MISADELIQGWLKGIDAPDIFFERILPELWDGIVGEKLARHTRPGPIRDSVLTIYVKSAYWKTNLAELQEDFCRSIGRVVPGKIVHTVSFCTSPARFPSQMPAAEPAPAARAEEQAWIGGCAALIDDPRLREAFERALTSYLRLYPDLR